MSGWGGWLASFQPPTTQSGDAPAKEDENGATPSLDSMQDAGADDAFSQEESLHQAQDVSIDNIDSEPYDNGGKRISFQDDSLEPPLTPKLSLDKVAFSTTDTAKSARFKIDEAKTTMVSSRSMLKKNPMGAETTPRTNAAYSSVTKPKRKSEADETRKRLSATEFKSSESAEIDFNPYNPDEGNHYEDEVRDEEQMRLADLLAAGDASLNAPPPPPPLQAPMRASKPPKTGKPPKTAKASSSISSSINTSGPEMPSYPPPPETAKEAGGLKKKLSFSRPKLSFKRSKSKIGKTPTTPGGSVDKSAEDVRLPANVDVKSVDKELNTLLHKASGVGNYQLVSILLERGSSIISKNSMGNTPLHLSCFNGHVEVAKRLLEAGSNIEELNDWQDTPLLLAAFMGRLEVVEFLVFMGADIEMTSSDGKTAVQLSMDEDHFAIASFLEQAHINKSKPHYEPPTISQEQLPPPPPQEKKRMSVKERQSRRQSIKEQKFSMDSRDSHLHDAVQEGEVQEMLRQLEQGANVDSEHIDGATALHMACLLGAIDATNILLHSGADADACNMNGNSPVHMAVFSGNIAILHLLLRVQVELNCINCLHITPLLLACSLGHEDMALLLLERGADPAILTEDGSSALLLAHKRGLVHVVQHIQQLGQSEGGAQDMDMMGMYEATARHKKNKEEMGGAVLTDPGKTKGWTTRLGGDKNKTDLLSVSQKGDFNTVWKLLERGVEVDQYNNVGDTPLIFCALNGHSKALQLLIEKGANVNWHNSCGNTPLHLAALAGKLTISKLLIAYGAHVDATNKDGDTPIMMSTVAGHYEICKFFIGAGADIAKTAANGATLSEIAIVAGHQRINDDLLELTV